MTQPSIPRDLRQTRRFHILVIATTVTAAALLLAQTNASLMDVWATARGYGSWMITLWLLGFLVWLLISSKPKAQIDGIKIAPNYRIGLARAHWDDVGIALGGMIATVSTFTAYKTTAIGNTGYGFDPTFIAWDRAIFGGQDPWQLTHAIFDTARATHIIDILYHPAFLPMFLGFLLCVVLQRRAALRYTYMATYLIGFVLIGMIMANALHSAGPIYDGLVYGDGTTFGPLIDRLAAQQAALDTDLMSVFAQDYLFRLYEAQRVDLGGGISAMPSVHIVLALLWTFAGWHINRILGAVLTVYAGVIWMGSVHLGWHYFVDGLVSLIVIGAVWLAVGRFVGLYGRG